MLQPNILCRDHGLEWFWLFLSRQDFSMPRPSVALVRGASVATNSHYVATGISHDKAWASSDSAWAHDRAPLLLGMLNRDSLLRQTSYSSKKIKDYLLLGKSLRLWTYSLLSLWVFDRCESY